MFLLATAAQGATEGNVPDSVPSVETAPPASGLGDIVVTAQRREESQQTVPVAVTVLPSIVFQRAGNFDPVDLGRVSTGLFANSYNGDRSNIYYTIRGQAYTTGTLFPAVVPYFAEVPLNKLLVGTFFDLDNVQTLRGPQGTLFGRVTDGGNILISPAKPTSHFEANVGARVGNYNLYGFDGMVNVPIVSDKLMIRGAFETNKRDGFTKNLYNGERLDGVNYQSYRISIVAKPTDNIRNYTVVNYMHAHETGGSAQIYYVNSAAVLAELTPIFGAAGAQAYETNLAKALATQQAIGARKTYNNTNAFDRRRQLVVTNKTTWDISENVSANAIFGYIFLRQHTANDYDGTTLSYSDLVNPYLPSSLTYQKQLSGEGQLQGKVLDDRLNWTIGTYFDKQLTPGAAEGESYLFNLLARSSVQSIVTKSRAVYGQASYDLSALLENLKVIGGVRYTHDTVSARSAVWTALISANPDPIPHGQCLATRPAGVLASSIPCTYNHAAFSEVTWNAGLEYQATKGLFVYGKVSKGYRPGGFNTTSVASSYGPETVVSHEIGAKTDFSIAGRPVRVNIAGFYDNFSNIQRLVTLVDSTGATTANVNTKSATVKGIELETLVKPFPALELGVRYTYLDAHYDIHKYDAAYIAAACPANPRLTAPDATKFCPLSPFARTPKDTVGLTARYTVPVGQGSISLGGDWYFTDHQYVVTTGYLDPEVRTPHYNVLNMDLTWKQAANLPLDITLFGTNVTNRTYISTVSSVSQMGSLGFANYSFGAPRMYGMRLSYHFGG